MLPICKFIAEPYPDPLWAGGELTEPDDPFDSDKSLLVLIDPELLLIEYPEEFACER